MSLPQPARRTENVDKSHWAELTALCRQNNAVNMGQGFPDFPPHPRLKEALMAVAQTDCATIHQYARSGGHIRLVNAMAKMYSTLLSRSVDPMDNIFITVGASTALYYCVNGYLNPGDEAIVIEPSFDMVESQIRMACGVPIFVPLTLEYDNKRDSNSDVPSKSWKIDFVDLESKFSSKTKLLFINNPHNPTGKVFTREELTKLADLAEKFNVIVVSDEVYEWIVYDDAEMIRFSTLPNMWKRTLTVGSVGKSFSVTGWKTGWIIGPQELLKPIQIIHHTVMYMCPTPLQEAIAVVFEKELLLLNTPDSYFKQLRDDLRTRRDRMAKMIRKMGLVPVIPDGSYFMLANIAHLDVSSVESGITNGLTKDFKFVKWLCTEKKLLGTPTSCFYSTEHRSMGEVYIRFCFAKKDSTFEAAEKLNISDLKI